MCIITFPSENWGSILGDGDGAMGIMSTDVLAKSNSTFDSSNSEGI